MATCKGTVAADGTRGCGGQRGQCASVARASVPLDLSRHLGALLVGTLIGGVPALAAAEQPAQKQYGPVYQHRQRVFNMLMGAPGTDSPTVRVPTAATSPMALLVPATLPVPAATFTVTTAADIVDPGDGLLSLREAVGHRQRHAALDAIDFAPSVEGQPLVLDGGQLTISQDLIIDGSGHDGGAVTIEAPAKSRVLLIGGTGTDVVLRNLDITGGYSHGQNGGGILLGAGNSLQLTAVEVRGNSAGGYYSRSGPVVGSLPSEQPPHHHRQHDLRQLGLRPWLRGRIYAASGSVVSLSRSRLERNSGTGYRYGNAGGMCVTNSTINIDKARSPTIVQGVLPAASWRRTRS